MIEPIDAIRQQYLAFSLGSFFVGLMLGIICARAHFRAYYDVKRKLGWQA